MNKNIEANIKTWGNPGAWEQAGENWSEAWGGTHRLYSDLIWPRIEEFMVPPGDIVEIAPGYGRITQFLLNDCWRFTGVDLNQNCVDHCKERFANEDHAEFLVNDGLTIPVGDNCIDFVFSWDSLVHCSQDVVMSYITEVNRVLRRGGAAFLHHSTWATSGAPQNPHWRDESCSWIDILHHCDDLGLYSTFELSSWGYKDYKTDCFTTIRKH